MKIHSTIASLVCFAALGERPARADVAPHATYALVVTSNRGSGIGRPDLHYADDDGAKYYEVFRTLAPVDGVTLLTRFDRDTARLYPRLRDVARPPTRAAVAEAARGIATKARASLAEGKKVDFYFVFAGHGDVDGGKGFVELEDGAFTADDLEALLKDVPSTRSHVILDSCNSFFMVAARKPGGHHFATPEDATRGLGQRLPNVGVLLSTSADGEVFEWSELGSGIFSHAVRSGLAGAADANGDGVVSYDELRGFVDVATANVKNPRFRPHVFARGPGGRDAEPLFATGQSGGVTLTLDPAPPLRLTLRDADQQPWVDLFKEPGAAVSLHLPEPLSLHGSAEESEVTGDVAHVRKRYDLAPPPAVAPVRLAALTPAPMLFEARGEGEIFRNLYTKPFGPHALAEYDLEQRTQPPPVYGVSDDDKERMRLLGPGGRIRRARRRRRRCGGVRRVVRSGPGRANGQSVA